MLPIRPGRPQGGKRASGPIHATLRPGPALSRQLVQVRRRSLSAAGDKEKALTALEHVYAGVATNLTVAIQLALAYDELGKTERRDEIFKAMTGTSPIVKLGGMFSDALAKDNKEGLDIKAVDGSSECRPSPGRLHVCRRLLDNRGKVKDATYFNRASGKDRRLALLSTVRLRDEGLAPKALDDKDPK